MTVVGLAPMVGGLASVAKNENRVERRNLRRRGPVRRQHGAERELTDQRDDGRQEPQKS
jgi:hypothetical protein